MAYLYQDPNDPNNPMNQQAGGAPPAGGQTTAAPTGSGGSLLGGGAPAAAVPAGGPAGSTPPPSSSGWTNLRAYLDANQDQVPGFASQISGQVTKQGNEAQGAVKGVADNYNAALAGAAPGDVGSLIGSANADPVKFAADPKNVSKLTNLENGVFNDPGMFEDQPGFGDAAAKAAAAGKLPSLVASEGGQKDLITKFNPQETAGQASLDQLLLSGSPGANNVLKGAAEPFANLRTMLDKSAQEGNASREKASTDTKNATTQIKNEFVNPQTDYATGLEGQIRDRLNQYSAEQFNKDAAIKDLEKYMTKQSDSLTPDEMSMFFPHGLPMNPGGGKDEATMRDLINSTINFQLVGRKPNPTYEELKQQNDYGYHYLLNGSDGDKLYPWVKGALDQLSQNAGGRWVTGTSVLDPIRSSISNFPNWMQDFFPNTAQSSGTPTAASVSTPGEAQKILALQKLITGLNPFLKEDDLNLAGTYKRPTTGQYKYPLMTEISDGVGTPLQFKG